MNTEISPRVPPPDFVERYRALYPHVAMLLDEKGMAYESFFSIRKTAKLLGVSTRTLQRRVQQQELRIRGIGRGRFHAEDLEHLLREGFPWAPRQGGPRKRGKNRREPPDRKSGGI